jgi:hypothetical protein
MPTHGNHGSSTVSYTIACNGVLVGRAIEEVVTVNIGFEAVRKTLARCGDVDGQVGCDMKAVYGCNALVLF